MTIGILEDFLWACQIKKHMNNEYKLKFSKPLLEVKDITGKIPATCPYPIPFAQKSLLFEFAGANFINQQLYYETFKIDMFHLNTDEPFLIEYTVPNDRIFFNFILHGQVFFGTEDQTLITAPKDCTFYLSAEKAGSYTAKVPKGSTDVIVISLLPGWIASAVDNYPTLSEAVEHLLLSKNRYEVLPHCRIDDQVREWMFEFLSVKYKNTIVQQSLLGTRIAMTLCYYEELLASTSMGKMYQIKRYIDRNILSTDLDLSLMCEKVYLSERTIIRRFKEEYGVSVKAYYNQVRMQQARQLIENEKLPIKEVVNKIGFFDESAFRRAYRKYLLEL